MTERQLQRLELIAAVADRITAAALFLGSAYVVAALIVGV